MKILLYVTATLVVGISAMYSPSDDVVELTPSNFNNLVINSDELWIVEFYAPWCGHCQQLTPEYKKAATALRGVVKIGAVNADDHKSLGGQYGIKGFPTIKVFGANKNSPTDYQGARTAQGIVDSAMSTVKSLVNDRMAGRGGSSKKKSGGSSGGGGGGGKKGNPADVVELTDSNFEELVLDSNDMWLVEFFAPWCGHCKTLAPHWAEAATNLKGKVKLGALDATVNTVFASRYGIQGFPTILHFGHGSKADGVFEVFDGDRSLESILLYANERFAANMPPPEMIQVQGYPTIKYFAAGNKEGVVDYDGGRTANDIIAWAKDKAAENIPAPEIVQLTSEQTMQDACEEHQLCVFAFLPHILDCQADCRNNYFSILHKLGEKYKKKQWGWLWAEAGSQPAAEEAFGIGGFGYPAMAAANSRKMKYAWLRGSFSEEGINEFLRDLSFGRGSTAPIKNAKLPDIQNIEPWDGKDGELPVEEEWDLSDVELDDLDDVKKEEL